MQPFNALGTSMPDEIEPPGYEHAPGDMMAETMEPMHSGEVIPFPQPEPPPEVTQLQRQIVLLQRLASMDNAAEAFKPEELAVLGSRVVREYQIDKTSRTEWEQTAARAMDLAKQKKASKSTPWDGASNVKYPMLTTAALQFAARAYPAIVDGPRIVKCAVAGRDPQGMKAAMADRVSQHMSYQLLYELPEWEADMDTALHQIPIVGCAFKKVYPDGTSQAGFRSDLISAFKFVVNQSTKSLETTPRATHVFELYPHEIGERIRAGRFVDFDVKSGGNGSEDEDAPHEFFEQHRYWDADGDGIDEPWIVTVHKKLEKVVRITPCFDVDKIELDPMRGRIIRIPRRKYFVKIPFLPDPEGGFYDIGFGKLLEALNDVIDTTLNQMMDAATLQNSGGGFAAAGVNLGKSRIKFKLGEYQTVPSAGQDIRQALYTPDFNGPSPVLFQLLSLMIEAGKDIASIKDILTGETPNNQTATSTMAAIEQGLKVFTAIYKRVFRALKEEYKLIYEINRAALDQPKYIALLDEPVEVTQADYHDDLDVMPVADPNTVTDMQRMAKAQFLMEQVAAGNPHINPLEATRRALEAARIERIEDVLVSQPPPPDPLQIEGAKTEVELKKAQVIKTTADAAVQLATASVPVNVPLEIAEPRFLQSDPNDPIGQSPMPQAPAPVNLEGQGPDPEELAMIAQQMGGAMPQPEAAPVPYGLSG